MKRQRLSPTLLSALVSNILLMVGSCAIADLPESSKHARAFTEADAIEMTSLGDPDYWHHNLSAGRVAHYSPDQAQMVVVLRRGNLSEGVTEYSLLHYQSKDLLQVPPPQPNVILRMSSSSNREVFASPTWLPDNRTLLFLGEQPGEERQVFSVDVRSRKLTQLTHSRTSVLKYSASADGTHILYMAEEAQPDIWNDQTRRRGVAVEKQSLAELIAGRFLPRPNRGDLYYVASPPTDGANQAKRIELPDRLDGGFIPLLSPDGRHALVRLFASSAPEKWRAYTDPVMQPSMGPVGQFIIIDTQTGELRAWLDAPQLLTDGGVDAKWAANGASALITLVYLPVDGVTGQERQRRLSGPFSAEIDLSGAVRALAPESLLQMSRIERWDSSSNVVTLIRESAEGGQRTSFRKQRISWRAIATSTVRTPPQVGLREGMNQPPRIVVLDPATKQEQTLLDLNPQFKDLKLARQEEIQWQASDGTLVRGGLYYPPDYVRGKRYPLVIQTHGWKPELFAVDGIFVSAFAAQALANKDMLVLQTWDFPAKDNAAAWQQYLATKMGTVGMHQLEQSIYEGAIDHLDAAGLIDRGKVGIIGFSFTCWSVKYALSHPRPGYRFAAAAVSDGFDGGYFNYVAIANQSDAQVFERVIGDQPYGPGLQPWLMHSPGFNIDKVDTPLRMLPLGNPQNLLGDWEWFTMLRRMNKPAELVMVEDGTHTLVKPWDRMMVNGGNVDWFDFWLNDRKDPAPEKAEQYERWERMRQ